MTDILTELTAERDIKILKARYCRFVDTKQWESLTDLFTPDASLFFPESQNEPCNLLDAMTFIRSALAPPMVSIHHVLAPEITFEGPDTAKGVWAMKDYLRWPESATSALGLQTLTGFGHYHEEYRRTAAGWKISKLRLARLRLERTMPVLSVL